jgi:hypothetical protein
MVEVSKPAKRDSVVDVHSPPSGMISATALPASMAMKMVARSLYMIKDTSEYWLKKNELLALLYICEGRESQEKFLRGRRA